MSCRPRVAVTLVAVACALLLACGARARAPTAETQSSVDLAVTAEVVAERLLQRILAHVRQEDSSRPERAKTLTVRAQLERELAAAEDVRGTPELVRAVAALERAYLASQLESTFAPLRPTPWSADDGRDQLGSPTCDAQLERWQPPERSRAFIKFALVAGADGVHALRVGPWNARHVDIAGGPALAAGVMRFDLSGARPVAVALENTSSGLRPGSLRNQSAVAALVALGYAPSEPTRLVVSDNPSAEYERSLLAQPMR